MIPLAQNIWFEIAFKYAVIETFFTGSVGTTASQITLTNSKGYKAVRIVNINAKAGMVLEFSLDGGTNYFKVPADSERIEIYNGESVYVKSNLADTDYEIHVLENQ